MNNMVYTFWDGKMPEYLKLCLDTWKFTFTLITYDTVSKYTNPLPHKLKQLSLPKIADYIRVHVLRDNGGYWLDVDTIMLSYGLPLVNILGNPETRTNTIGYLYSKPNNIMYYKWALFQEYVVNTLPIMNADITEWNIMGNLFTDYYLARHDEVEIGDISPYWIETKLISENVSRQIKYISLYFERQCPVESLPLSNMIMLHNSWTPSWYKKLDRNGVLNCSCTLSNILKHAIN